MGGGTAGWITACVVAAESRKRGEDAVEVVLVESPDIPIIGVGEGTWPSMRMTLQRIGLAEDDLIRECGASFKQGTRFRGWSGIPEAPEYTHPFSLPLEYSDLNPAIFWLAHGGVTAFADLVTPQARVIELGLRRTGGPPQYASPSITATLPRRALRTVDRHRAEAGVRRFPQRGKHETTWR